MKKTTCIAIIFLVPFFVRSQELDIKQANTIIAEELGDLDNDGITEKVIVRNTSDTIDDAFIREIQIFKRAGNNWVLWKASRNAILRSDEGGAFGDPFTNIRIENGILFIYHIGGSGWKWARTDKYRFQNNEFELIGFTNHYGKPCEYWEHLDFNLATGKIIFTKEFEKCKAETIPPSVIELGPVGEEPKVYKTETETFYRRGVKLNLSDRNLKERKFISPKYKYEFYL